VTRAARWLRRLLERLLDRWAEGPEPPRRIRDEARLFRHQYPDASAGEWERFAVKLAGNAYRDAFVRGVEWDERCWPERDIDGHAVGCLYGHDVSLGDGDPHVAALLAREPDPGMTPEQLSLIAELERSQYPFRIVFKEPTK
jgi:hypothetical protein